ncbi:glycosyl transferase containing protein [Pseudoscourfieldia marina]
MRRTTAAALPHDAEYAGDVHHVHVPAVLATSSRTLATGGSWLMVSLLANAVLLLLLLFVYEDRSAEVGLASLVRNFDNRPDRETLAESLAEIHRNVQDTATSLERFRRAGDVDVAAASNALPTAEARSPCPKVSTTPARDAISGTSASADSPVWLAIAIPTVRRKDDADYLTPTLESLLAELPNDEADVMWGRVVVYVMNCEPAADEHRAFFNTERHIVKAYGAKAAAHVRFLATRYEDSTLVDPVKPGTPEPDDLNNPTNRPGKRARKQTLDVLSLMRYIFRGPKPSYYMFFEDDFKACPHSLRAVHYVIDKVNVLHANKWLGIRVSYGMNGIVLRADDVSLLDTYLADNVERQPVDLLWREWSELGRGARLGGDRKVAPAVANALRGRRLFIYQSNLYAHIGHISSFEVRPKRQAWPGCYEGMHNVWSLAATEKYQAACRTKSDISPCDTSDAFGGRFEWTTKPIAFV